MDTETSFFTTVGKTTWHVHVTMPEGEPSEGHVTAVSADDSERDVYESLVEPLIQELTVRAIRFMATYRPGQLPDAMDVVPAKIKDELVEALR